MLAVVTRRHAQQLGLQPSEGTQYVILGMPDDCEVARSVGAHIDVDPAAVKLGIDDLDGTTMTA